MPTGYPTKKYPELYVRDEGTGVYCRAFARYARLIDWLRAQRAVPSVHEVCAFVPCSPATAHRLLAAWHLTMGIEE